MNTLTLLGDLAPTDLTRVDFGGGAVPSGLTLANLEVPLCDANYQSSYKSGPHLRAHPSLLPALAGAFSPLVLSLANNHIMDFGAAGLDQTVLGAYAAKVQTVGAGASFALAVAPLQIDLNGQRIGIIAATDRWFGLAAHGRAGAAPLDHDFVRRVRLLRREVDLLIASVHGGSEVSPWPSPRWQQHLRLLAESGADIVHAHHPHVPLGWERWGESWIVYGLGNTLVNPARWPAPEWTRRSWRVEFDLANLQLAPGVSEWEVQPQGAEGAALRCLQPAVSATSAEVAERNQPLADPLLLEGLHQEYAVRLWQAFYADRINHGDTAARRVRLGLRILRDSVLATCLPLSWCNLRRDRGLFHYHLYSADAHADEIATALGVLHGERPDRRTAHTRRLAGIWLPASLFAS